MKHYCNRQSPKSVTHDARDERKTNKSSTTNGGIAHKNNVCGQSGKLIESHNTTDGEEAADNDIVYPPGADMSGLRALSASDRIYNAEVCPEVADFGIGVGGAVSQSGGYKKQMMTDAEKSGLYICPYLSEPRRGSLYADNVSGSFDVVSVPSDRDKPNVLNSMMKIIQKYKGKFICIDIWNNDSIRIEKCGYLEGTDKSFLMIENPSDNEVTMLDLNTVKYISIYCK